ncbi:DUF485 domain-containing protein [Microbacterium koreense]|uniref:DUF485 domain-containing protein n=1 Tax=Microbacterium koreense TaxID=323761 RepID=A0ABW2ZQW5_9MICO
MSDTSTDAAPPGGIDYIAVEDSPRFRELKRRQRSFVFPMSIAFLVWYFLFVLMASFAPDVMAIPVWGNINLGLILGLGQFVTTFAITMGYVAYANRKLDPIAEELRGQLEKQEASA